MAALLDESAARVDREAVPVADLLQEREAMLPDGDHDWSANDTAHGIVDDARDGRHVRVFEAYVGASWTLVGGGDYLATVRDGGAQWLLDEDVHVRVGDAVGLHEDVVVGVVGCGDNGDVAEIGGEELDGGPEDLYRSCGRRTLLGEDG